jgi:uncharacterized OB-fold protein
VREGIVYSETVIHSAPAQFAADAPYQLALVEFAEGNRLMVRIQGSQVRIGDRVREVENQSGYPIFEVIA